MKFFFSGTMMIMWNLNDKSWSNRTKFCRNKPSLVFSTETTSQCFFVNRCRINQSLNKSSFCLSEKKVRGKGGETQVELNK